MAYVHDICDPTIRALEHSAGLPTFQLSGHAANADFWVEEAAHCLAVIDGYYARFNTLQTAQKEFVSQNKVQQAALGPDGRH